MGSNMKRMSLDGREAPASDLIMGIDLGTTNSAVSVYTKGLVPTLCPMGVNGRTTLQSCVRWDGGDKFTVGPEAYADRYKPNVCYSVKRIMGSGQTVTFQLSGQTLVMTPAQVSAKILEALADKVADSFGRLTRCVITVPAYFNQRQIEDTVEASKIAGLECVQILKEPTSASYIYSELGYASDGSILIYDLGGGTFDVTHMSFLKKSSIPAKMLTALNRMYGINSDTLSEGEDSSLYYCRVLGTYGDMNLGGDDIDSVLAKLLVKRSTEEFSDTEFEELKLRCEQFKKGGIEAADIAVGGKKVHVTKTDLQDATRVVFHQTLAILDQIPEREMESINTIVLVGGSTKSQFLLDMLEETFPGKTISRVLDPDATVALGAGAVAQDLYEGKSLMYQDVLPMAIGVLESEDHIDVCIPKNTAMPHSVSRTYHTMYDNQEAISVEVYQGVSSDPRECTHLGKLRVPNLPKKPAGEVEVRIYFMLSAQGRLTVSTNVDGVVENHEMTIDSIFNVSAEKELAVGSLAEQFNFDDFETAIAELCEGNTALTQLVIERRKAIGDGNVSEAEALEAKILEAL